MEKPNNENITQSMDEIESLNDSDELDIESLEKIAAADGCVGRFKKWCLVHWNKSKSATDPTTTVADENGG